MISNHNDLPLDRLVSELFGRASRRRGLVTAGWILALASHAGAALLFTNQASEAPIEPPKAPVEVEFVTTPEPEPPPPAPEAPPEVAPAAHVARANAAPPAAARAGALHLAKADAAPAQQPEAAVDFTTDPNAASYGGGVVAVGGTASLGAVGARVVARGGSAPLAPATGRPAGEALTAAADLTRKPRLTVNDPCRGFFPGLAREDSGDVAVMVTIGKSGRVSQTQLLSENPRGQGFGAAARTCLASQTFVPALDRAGNSAATAIRVNIRFSR